MADQERDSNGFGFKCPVWRLESRQYPGGLVILELPDGGKFICIFTDEDLAVRFIETSGQQLSMKAVEIPTYAAFADMLTVCQNAGVSLVAIDCKNNPSDAQAAYPVDKLLQLLTTPRPRETPVQGWQYLVRRHHPWRQQLYVKGRNMTARQLIGSMKANEFDEEKTATDFGLPVEAVREALAYVEQNTELLQTEAEIERLMHKRGGVARGPQPVS